MKIIMDRIIDNQALIDVCEWMNYINESGKYIAYFEGTGYGEINIIIERRHN